MSSKALQRGIVIAMVLATVGGALAAYFVSRNNLDSARTDRIDTAQQRISDALRRRAYYLEDIGDMVGVHDDADYPEFSRWAHVRGRNEGAIVSVEWVRHSPSGKLVPPHDIGPHPMLVAPADPGNASLAQAVTQPAAAGPLRLASLRKQIAISQPIKLANGDAGFYMSVPVVSHRYSGEISSLESQSAIVGLIDAQQLVGEALPASAQPDAPAAARSGDAPRDDRLRPRQRGQGGDRHAGPRLDGQRGRRFAHHDREASSLADPADRRGAHLTVALMLRTLARRRDAALELASQRSAELAASLERVERANRELERARADAERLSREDPVTGIFNRRHFGEVLARELSDPKNAGIRPCSCSTSITSSR